MRWPFMLKSTHEETFEKVRLENYTLRDALKEANAELVRHRKALSGLRKEGSIAIVPPKSERKA